MLSVLTIGVAAFLFTICRNLKPKDARQNKEKHRDGLQMGEIPEESEEEIDPQVLRQEQMIA